MPVIVFSGCKTGCATALGMSFIVLLCPKAVSPLSFPSRTFPKLDLNRERDGLLDCRSKWKRQSVRAASDLRMKETVQRLSAYGSFSIRH